jgi:hypothetical protein
MKKIFYLSVALVLLVTMSQQGFGQYTGSFPNVAAFKTALSSDTLAGFEPDSAVDTILTSYATIPGGPPAWLQIDLGSFHYVNGFGFSIPATVPDQLPRAITLQRSIQQTWWTYVTEVSIESAGTYSYDIELQDSVRYIRFLITDKDALASFAEVYIYGEAMLAPTPPIAWPAQGITPFGFTASWTLRENATGYYLTIFSDPSYEHVVPGFDRLDVGNVLSFEVDGLLPGADYYYGIQAYSIVGTSSYSNIVPLSTPKADQEITFDSLAAYAYGDADFDLAATASSGLSISYTNTYDTVAFVTGTMVHIVGIGTTTITASQEGNDQYNAAEPVSWDLVIQPKALEVTGALVEDKVYDGTTDAVIIGASLSGVVGSDDVVLLNATAGTFASAGAGTGIAVTHSMEISGADIGHYTFTPPDLSGDILPRELTITADDKTREECEENPEFTLSYEGFIEGEGIADLDSEPTVSCSADASSPDGTYEILVSGGSAANYALVLVNGTLTVNPDLIPPELTVQDITVDLGEDNVAVITPDDLVTSASDNCEVVDTTISHTFFTPDNIGVVAVSVTVTDRAGNETQKTSMVTVIQTTGVEDASRTGFIYYPNPVSDVLFVETGSAGNIRVEIASLNGQVVFSSELAGPSHELELSGLQKGIYFITIDSQDGHTTHKLIKR